MTTFQLLLLIVAGGVFYLFFKQLFSGDHPKRGVDFEANVPDEQIGGINRPDKTFSKPEVQPTRMEQLLQMTDEAVEKNDYEEAKKALGSAHIIDADNIGREMEPGRKSRRLSTAEFNPHSHCRGRI